MSWDITKSNGNILRNYIYSNIVLYKLANILIKDWKIADKVRFSNIYELLVFNLSEYGNRIKAFIDTKDVNYYWYLLYPIIKELNSEILTDYDINLYDKIKNSLQYD